MNAATLQDARTGAGNSLKETIAAVGRGEPLPEDWLDLCFVAGWTVEKFQAAVAIAERRHAARQTLAGLPGREEALQADETELAKLAADAEAKVAKIQADAERKIAALTDPVAAQRRDLDSRRAAIRYERQDAKAVLRDTADAAHVKATDAEIERLNYRRDTLSRDVARYAVVVGAGRSDERTAADVAKWRAELESIDGRIRVLNARRFDYDV